MLGALISGGVSLLSGLLGRSSAKAQAKKEEAAIAEANRVASENAARMNLEVRTRADAAALVPVQSTRGVDMDAFMSAAEDYGFNPLTFLRSGALSSFEWSCVTGEHAMDAGLAGQYIPQLAPVLAQTKVPGMGDVFGNALTSGANQYLSEAAEQRAFQNDVMKMQLQGAQRAGAYSGLRFGTVPQAFLQPTTKSTKVQTKGNTIWDLAVGETLVDGIIAHKMFLPVVDNSASGKGRVTWIPDMNLVPDSEVITAAGVLVGGNALAMEGEQFDARWSAGLPSAVRRLPLPGVPRHFTPVFKTSGRGTR